jgi:hypothetical protein
VHVAARVADDVRHSKEAATPAGGRRCARRTAWARVERAANSALTRAWARVERAAAAAAVWCHQRMPNGAVALAQAVRLTLACPREIREFGARGWWGGLTRTREARGVAAHEAFDVEAGACGVRARVLGEAVDEDQARRFVHTVALAARA